MEEYSVIKTKQYRGCGFMTVCKYNNAGDIIYIGDKDSKIISAIDTQDYNVIGTFSGHNGVIWSLDISKNDDILVSASGDLTIGFFDAKKGTKLFQSNERCVPKFVCTQKKYLSPDTNLVGIICEALTKKSSTYISIYDLDTIGTDNFTEKIKLIWSRQSKPTVMTWKSNDEIIIGCDDGKIILRKLNDVDGEMEKEYQIHSNAIKSVVWNKTYTHILTSSLDCAAKHLDVTNEFNVISTYKSSVPINYAIWNHNNRKVILGGGIEAMNVAKTSDNDLNVKIYRTSDQKLTNHIQSHFGPIRFIDKAPGTKNFMTASQDGSVKIYLIDDGETNDGQKELMEQTKYDRFGSGLNEDNRLTDETNKMLNLSWKPPKVKKQVIEQKWIPGMPIPKNKTGNDYKPSNLTSDMNDKLEELKKQEKEQNSTVIITNLPPDIRTKELYDLFDLYGRIEERGGIRIKDYTDSTIAFIKYVYPEAALKAIEVMDGYVINHCIIKVEMAKPKI
jgi:translation initiation factor 3 subunit I